MLEEDLLAGVVGLCPEVHREGGSVEGQARKRHAVDGLVLGNQDRGGIGDDFGRVVVRLVGVVELDALDLRGGLDRDEGLVRVRDAEHRSGGLPVRDGAAAGGTVDAHERHVLFQDQSGAHRVAAFDGLEEERGAAAGGPVDGVLELDLVDAGGVLRQDAEGLDGVGEGRGPFFGGDLDLLDDGILDGFPDDLGAGHQGKECEQQRNLRFHG